MKELSREVKFALATNDFSAAVAAGYTLSDAVAAGYSLREAKEAGYTLRAALTAGYMLRDARLAGYSLREAKEAGYTLRAARLAGYSIRDAMAAGYSIRDAREAGYPLSEILPAGYTLHEAREAGYSVNDAEIPLIERPYSRMLEDIQSKRRIHKQSTWGPRNAPVRDEHLCGTAMCTAGHLVQMGGELGWELQEKYGFAVAATLIHYKAHPDQPCQDFGAIPDDFALAYIETMAEREAVRPVADPTLLGKEQG